MTIKTLKIQIIYCKIYALISLKFVNIKCSLNSKNNIKNKNKTNLILTKVTESMR